MLSERAYWCWVAVELLSEAATLDVTGTAVALCAILARRRALKPSRQPLWRTPFRSKDYMAIDLLEDRGTPIEQQRFTWKDLVQTPYSKLDDDAFTRVRVILMNGIESEALRFSHACARMNRELQLDLARIRRIEQHQQTLINWLNPPDQNVLETTIGFEQVAIEVTAAVALAEPDEYLAQVYRFGLLEDFDHMYRYSAPMDRVEGKDANTLLQSYTDILPGRPTSVEHRAPEDELRQPYDKQKAALITKLHANTLMAARGHHEGGA